MKKILVVAVLALASVPALAQHWHRGHHHHHRSPTIVYRDNNWVIPALIGGAVVYAATRPAVVEQPPVIVQHPSLVYQTQPNCSPWTETQNSDGTITRTRICNQ